MRRLPVILKRLITPLLATAIHCLLIIINIRKIKQNKFISPDFSLFEWSGAVRSMERFRSTGQFRSHGDVLSMERSYCEAFVLRGTTVYIFMNIAFPNFFYRRFWF